MDGDEREPVAAIHAVAREVDPQRGLRQLRWHLLRRQRHLPGLVRVPVQAEVLLLCSSPTSPPTQINHTEVRPEQGRDRVGIERRDAEAQLTWIALRVEVLDVCERGKQSSAVRYPLRYPLGED